MINTVFLYVYLTFIPPEETLARTIEVNLPMANMEFCERASEDLQVNIDALFDYEGDKIHVDAECVDISDLITPGSHIDIEIEDLENVRG